jgi:hypothetical protein
MEATESDAGRADTPTGSTSLGHSRPRRGRPASTRSTSSTGGSGAPAQHATANGATARTTREILDSILTPEEQEQIRSRNRERRGEVCIACLDPCHCVDGAGPGPAVFPCGADRGGGAACDCSRCDCLSARRGRGLDTEPDRTGWVPGAQGTAPGFKNPNPR